MSESVSTADSTRSRTISGDRIVDLVIAGLVAALGIYVTLEARGIRVLPVHARVGPRVFPYLVGAGLVILGVWMAVEILTGRDERPVEEAEDADASLPTDWRCMAILSAALLVYLVLLERAGFVIASTVLFVMAAFGMGSRSYVRDAIAALAIAGGIYVAFTQGLDIRLPAGWLEGLE